MDVSIFKASRGRLISWIVVPPLLIVSMGLGAHALQRQSQWELNRTKELAKVLPVLVQMQRQASGLLAEFNKDPNGEAIESEDRFISFLQEAAQRSGFTIDSVKVERRTSAMSRTIPVLSASVKGTGSLDVIELYLGDVTAGQHLLSESAVKLSQVMEYNADFYQAELAFDLLLFDESKVMGRSVK